MFFIFEELLEKRLGAIQTDEDIVFQITNPIPRYTKYELKSWTLKTVPYTKPKVEIDSKFENPSQKLPRVVLANLALVLDVAVYHHTLLLFIANLKSSIIIAMDIIMGVIII